MLPCLSPKERAMRKLLTTFATAVAMTAGAMSVVSIGTAAASGECQGGTTGDLGTSGDPSQGRGWRPIVCLVDPNPYP
jgi:hypothetical protein